jgi:hypothetical protein
VGLIATWFDLFQLIKNCRGAKLMVTFSRAKIYVWLLMPSRLYL